MSFAVDYNAAVLGSQNIVQDYRAPAEFAALNPPDLLTGILARLRVSPIAAVGYVRIELTPGSLVAHVSLESRQAYDATLKLIQNDKFFVYAGGEEYQGFTYRSPTEWQLEAVTAAEQAMLSAVKFDGLTWEEAKAEARIVYRKNGGDPAQEDAVLDSLERELRRTLEVGLGGA
jgi:hypothetical protein